LWTTLWAKIMKAHTSRDQFASAVRLAASSESSVRILGTVATHHRTSAANNEYPVLIQQITTQC